MTTQNPIVEELVALILGDLSPSQAATLEARITREPEARRLLENIRELVRALQTDDGASPPETLVLRVKGMMGAASSAAAPIRSPLPSLREVVAALVFDSFGKVAIAGFRGTVAGRQLAYSSDTADVDLQVTAPDASRRSIRGQVSPAGNDSAIEVVLARPGDASALASTPVDSRGMFSLDSSPGTFDLRVRIGDSVVMLPALNIE